MRKLFVGLAVLALMLAAGTAFAAVNVDEGLIPASALPSGLSWNDNFVKVTGASSTWSGIYDYDDTKWIDITPAGYHETPIAVTCDIEMYVTMTLDNDTVYFHIGKPTTYMEALLHGTITTNNGQAIGILIPGQDVSDPKVPVLKFVEDGFGRHYADMSEVAKLAYGDIPVSLEFSYWTGTEWTAPDPGQWGLGNGNSDYAWWWSGVPIASTHEFQIKVDITPDIHQGDGRYTIDPVLVAAPVL